MVANWVVFVPLAGVGAAGVPVNVGEAIGAPPAPVTSARSKVTVPVLVLKLATPAVPPATAAVTKAVLAICVVLVPGAAVGARGNQVKLGELSGAREVSIG